MSVRIEVEPFDHQDGGNWPGSRGIRITSAGDGSLPTVYVDDGGGVEIEEYRVSGAAAVQWLEQVADLIRQHVDDHPASAGARIAGRGEISTGTG